MSSHGAETCTSTTISANGILTAKHCVGGGGLASASAASTSDRQTTTAYTNMTAYRSWIRSVAGV